MTRKRPCLWGGLPRISPECAGDGTLAAKPEPGAIVIAEPRSWREIRRRLGTSYATRLGGHRSVLACQPLRGSTQRLLFRVNVLTAVGRPRSTNCGAPISMLLAGGAKRSGGPDGGSCAVTNLTGRRATWWPGEAGWCQEPLKNVGRSPSKNVGLGCRAIIEFPQSCARKLPIWLSVQHRRFWVVDRSRRARRGSEIASDRVCWRRIGCGRADRALRGVPADLVGDGSGP
jgi:hypothetical protein